MMNTLDLSLENLYRQYYRCRRNKRNTINALRFEAGQEKHLLALREALVERTYQPGRSVCFVTTRPKLREVFAADFADRVVHHLLVDYLERIWEPVFIHDSYACRRGKGVHAAVLRLQRFLREATANGTQRAWYLQLDVRNYFMSLDKDRLFALLAARLSDPAALWLTRVLVYHDCTSDYLLRGAPGLLARVPAHKSLFGAAPGKGLPIGNLNSQFFANVYLNGLDQFIKHELRCRHYLRYCDDLVLLSRDPDELGRWRNRIEEFLDQKLLLQLNPRQRLAPVSDGIDFLGYIVRREYRLVRRRVVAHFEERLRTFEARLVRDGRGVRCFRFDHAALDQLASVLASYLGHFRLANTWGLWQALWRRHPFLAQYFALDRNSGRPVRTFVVPADLISVRRQYRHFRWRFPEDVLFFKVGRFIEFYDLGRPRWLQVLKLQPMRPNRRGARYGFPQVQMERHLRTLLAQGFSVTFIREQRSPMGVRRLPAWRLTQPSDAQRFAMICANSRFDVPSASSDFTSRSSETVGSPASIFATRDWLDRSECASWL